MEVAVDEEACFGAGQCVATAPTVFSQRQDGIVILRQAHTEGELDEAVREAALLCPARAITLSG